MALWGLGFKSFGLELWILGDPIVLRNTTLGFRVVLELGLMSLRLRVA